MAYRRDLIEILATGPRTASSLARELGLARRDMADELQHIVRSARTAGYEVRVEPARCKSCGFLFGETKLTKPGKCPSCKGTRLYEPLIRLEKGSTIPARMTWSHEWEETMNSKDDTTQPPARRPHGTTQDQVNEMESEGQAIKPGQEPNRSQSDDHATVEPSQKKDEKPDTAKNNS